MSFGDFMKGMQGGMTTMQDLRKARQVEDLYDYAIADAEEEFGDRNADRVKGGLEPIKKRGSTTLLGRLTDKMDPVIARWMEKLGRGTGTTESPVAGELPTSEELDPTPPAEAIPTEEALPIEDPILAADGKRPVVEGTDELGNWLDDKEAGKPKRPKYNDNSPDEIEKRASRARGAKPAPSEAIPTQVEGDPSKYRPAGKGQTGNAPKNATRAGRAAEWATEHAKYKGVGGPSMTAAEGAGALRTGARKVVGGLGRGAIIGSVLAAGSGGIRGALDAETTGDGFWSDVGQRAAGAGKGVVAGVLDPLGEPGRWMDRGEEEAPAAAPAEQEAIPTRGSGPNGPRRYPGQGAARRAAAAGPQAIPTAPTARDPLEDFDITQFKASEIPNFSNSDWMSHRKDLLQSYMRSGLSYAEAYDKADQQAIATQQRGFMHFAKQAYTALVTSGKSSPEAGAAIRAAFQYLPSTTDIQVGEYNGHLVAFGVDEDTGEQVGKPVVITPDLLERIMMNFQDPKAWAEHAQDNKKLDQADRELDQGDRRLGILEGGLEVERENALTKRLDAIGVPGATGSALKESDIAAAGKAIDEWAYQFARSPDGEDVDPALPSALKALAEAEFARKGGGNLRTIMLRLEEMLKSPGGAETIIAAARRLASGQ